MEVNPMNNKLMLFVSVLFLFAVTAGAKTKYEAVAIQNFGVSSGIEFPADYLISLHEDLKEQLEKTGQFSEVRVGDPEVSQQNALRITGEITKYKPGSRVQRALFGMLAGETKVEARIQVFDAASGQLLFSDDVDGKVTYWSPDQDSKGATRGLAKEVAKVIKKRLL
jgi:hypothetical protein